MLLDEFKESTTQIALSNVANKRKSITPLLLTIFKYTKPSKTTAVELVHDTGKGKILPVNERFTTNKKTPENTIGIETRHGKTLTAMHVTGFADISADAVQDIPKPISNDSLESFERYVSGEVDTIEECLEATREYHALGALKGKVVDVDGTTVIYDLYDFFKIDKSEATISDLSLKVEDGLRIPLHQMKSKAKSKLKGKIIKGFVMLCGSGAYEEFAFCKDAKTDMRNNELKYVVDGFSDGFNYQSVDFVEYDGGIGDESFIGENEAMLLPIVDGLYCITATPGKGTNYVNKKGQKTYITTKVLDHDAGVELKGQANYVVYVEVPDAIQHVTVNITD